MYAPSKHHVFPERGSSASRYTGAAHNHLVQAVFVRPYRRPPRRRDHANSGHALVPPYHHGKQTPKKKKKRGSHQGCVPSMYARSSLDFFSCGSAACAQQGYVRETDAHTQKKKRPQEASWQKTRGLRYQQRKPFHPMINDEPKRSAGWGPRYTAHTMICPGPKIHLQQDDDFS